MALGIWKMLALLMFRWHSDCEPFTFIPPGGFMMTHVLKHRPLLWLGLSFFLTSLLWLATAQTLAAADDVTISPDILVADLSGSTKTVNANQALPGTELDYTIVLSNSGTTPASVTLTDTLPVSMSLSSTPVSSGGGTFTVTGNTIYWFGFVNNGTEVEITYQATIDEGATAGSSLVNTALIDDGAEIITRTASVNVIEGSPDFTWSSKTVNRTTALPGSILLYTISLSNTGNLAADPLVITDTISTLLTFVGTPTSSHDGTFAINGRTLTWTGVVTPNVEVVLQFQTRIANNAPAGSLVNSVTIGEEALIRTASTQIVTSIPTTVYLPVLMRPLNTPVLSATRPNSSNQWTLSWTESNGSTTFEVQESLTPDFSSVTTVNPGTAGSYQYTKELSTNHIYYYRVRAISSGQTTAWSNAVEVIGGYRDEFTSNTTGWALRRLTNLDKVKSFYENSQNGFAHHYYVIQIQDRYDWGLASPLARAPQLPYAAEYKAQPASLNNFVSSGGVVGGDWNGQTCPDYSTTEGTYQHTRCFNKFYLYNNIFSLITNGYNLKTLFERVDTLVWCPECGGSPMKRLGETADIPTITGDPTGWTTYRIEVRSTGVQFYVNNVLKHSHSNATHVNNPYFGIFGSTSQYSNSTWRYEYFQVKPLDS